MYLESMQYEVFTVVKIQVKVHLKMVAAKSSETMLSYCNTIWHHNPEDNMGLTN
jgi:hypothetical protein